MKKLLTITLLIIIFIFSYNKYQDYQRFNGPQTNYEANKDIDINYHNQAILFNYQNAISSLNGFVNTQWSSHKIDVINPEKENKKTLYAVDIYTQKLAQVKHLESILKQSADLKKKGFTNSDIQLFEKTGLSPSKYQESQEKQTYKRIVKSSFTNKNIVIGEKSPLVFEVQKLLVKNGFNIIIDGIFKTETSQALKDFEAKHNLLPDGKLDQISLEYLLKNI